MNKYIAAYDEWMRSDDLPLKVKLACIAAVLTCVSQFLNIGMTVYIGSSIETVLAMLVMMALLLFGVTYTVKSKNHVPQLAMMCIVCFVFMPIVYVTSGGLHCGGITWMLFAGVILGTIVPDKFVVPVVVLYVFLNTGMIVSDGFNPGIIPHLDESAFALDAATAFALVTIFLLVYMYQANKQYELKNADLVGANTRLSKSLTEVEEAHTLLENSYLRIEREKENLDALAEIYNTMYLMNIKLKTYEVLGSSERTAEDAEILHVQQFMWRTMRDTICKDHLEEALRFTDFSTINERMQGKRSIAFEAINYKGEWWRYLFIRVGDLESDVANLIYTSQYIDQEVREKENLIRLSNVDEMTKALNRNAYIAQCKVMDEKGIPDDFWYMTVDINGLKTVNDNIGHDAGDELILGAAESLMKAVGKKGSVFRTGGDEFVAFVYGDDSVVDDVLEDLKVRVNLWNNRHEVQLHISKGCVRATEMPGADVARIGKVSDIRMYADKDAYYKRHPELNRRIQ